ncbi:hypothetical protein [Sphingomonas sp.]|uniref:NMCC_0638 family (lipo)protein n=1 Tax=Sphingomonas sp. TaxID=28214 RepID=UPI0025897B72|nr:hypothetical protein [Sphingomonas sp.]
MMMLAAALLLQAAATTAPPTTPVAGPAAVAIDIARMAALYDEVCLQTFPIDAAVDALMIRKKATPMTAAHVKVTLRDDPGRGWTLRDGDQVYDVVLELPPFHACSVRTSDPMVATGDLEPYRAVADAFMASHRGFTAGEPMDMTRGGIKIHAEMQGRPLPGKLFENLLVVEQKVVDAALLEPGSMSSPLRFVHQIGTGQ